MPYDVSGETVCVVIVCYGGVVATEQEILDGCDGRLADYERPRSIAFIDESDTPRTATGKIKHRHLREQWTTQGIG